MGCLQNDSDIDEDFSFIQPIDLITKDVYELQKMIKEKKESLQKTKNREKNKEHEQEHAREKEKEWVFLMNKTYNCILILYFFYRLS